MAEAACDAHREMKPRASICCGRVTHEAPGGCLPSTFEAFWVIVFALLPGALYTWAFEREAAAWGAKASDRILRFVGMSTIFHAAAAPLSFYIYAHAIHGRALFSHEMKYLWLWPIALLYVAVPIAAGWIIGAGARNRRPWVRIFVGAAPAPRAWDHFFSTPNLTGWIRLRLKSGEWIFGAYAGGESSPIKSYAAGYPEDQDILLSQTIVCDQSMGNMTPGPGGLPQFRNLAILVRWDEVSYLEYVIDPIGGGEHDRAEEGLQGGDGDDAPERPDREGGLSGGEQGGERAAADPEQPDPAAESLAGPGRFSERHGNAAAGEH
jgi:hypothetical protein